MECGEWNFTPSLSNFSNEVNPFDYIGVQKAKESNAVSKQESPLTPPNTNASEKQDTTNGEVAKAPPTPPQPNKGEEKRRPQNVTQEKVSSNASLDSESSDTSGESATGMKALTKAVEIESQQLKKQRLQQQNTRTRSQRGQNQQYSFHSYQPTQQTRHSAMPPTHNNSTLIIKQENGQPNSKNRRHKDKAVSSNPSDTTMTRKRSSPDDDNEEAAERRRKFLERNRVAASKCRQKKKAWVNDLEGRSEQVLENNKRLSAMVAQLKEEAMFLKNQLLAHGNCSCDVVKQYLQQNTKFADQPTNVAFPPSQQTQMLPPPPPPQQRPKQTGEDYFASVHSTPTPSLPPLRATASTG
ncbi:unnamed protein product [Umbelopsis sp. WA50703]